MAEADTARETGWSEGWRAAWLRQLQSAVHELGYDSPEAKAVSWIAEREAAIAQLREVCRDFGDNDWDDNLHLADIIEKHLARNLYANDGE